MTHSHAHRDLRWDVLADFKSIAAPSVPTSWVSVDVDPRS
jgi:hypothetical protein